MGRVRSARWRALLRATVLTMAAPPRRVDCPRGLPASRVRARGAAGRVAGASRPDGGGVPVGVRFAAAAPPRCPLVVGASPLLGRAVVMTPRACARPSFRPPPRAHASSRLPPPVTPHPVAMVSLGAAAPRADASPLLVPGLGGRRRTPPTRLHIDDELADERTPDAHFAPAAVVKFPPLRGGPAGAPSAAAAGGTPVDSDEDGGTSDLSLISVDPPTPPTAPAVTAAAAATAAAALRRAGRPFFLPPPATSPGRPASPPMARRPRCSTRRGATCGGVDGAPRRACRGRRRGGGGGGGGWGGAPAARRRAAAEAAAVGGLRGERDWAGNAARLAQWMLPAELRAWKRRVLWPGERLVVAYWVADYTRAGRKMVREAAAEG
ncbi:hypothetical protein BU14_0256s0009 [Porphyra umbilicalis]|uniref:Uncharacterized protein n=1 Tax=Porphyra umbilicalis TaxID=2786 RepID=A0A1X6P2P2_PORUM|nr:hypothetical protein BU14_0256s0009 [Porphyra umbilicalis]|eukprot:OSX75056.1 hypothetical protein BU14_0256s0009 [Porphyra umbilicalis]